MKVDHEGLDGASGQEAGQGVMSRRDFVRAASFAVLSGGILMTLSGCSAENIDSVMESTGVKDTLDAALRGKRTVVDHAGREVTIPTVDTLERVYFTGANGQIPVFSLAPDLMAGTGIVFTPEELKYLPEGTENLEHYGSLSGNGEIDREALIAADVQLVIDSSSTTLSAADIDVAQNLQNMTGIPVVCADGSFDKIADCYRFLGDILGREERAEELASYLENIYNEVTSALSGLRDEDKVTLYYAEGPLGLQTEPDESMHALTFYVAGANNVAAVEVTQGLGMSNVSLESVLRWDPEVIIAWDAEIRGGAEEIIRTDADWAPIRAVRNGRVYTMPNAPYAWCDRPPSVNRFLGIQWVANMLYPDLYDVDMVEVTKDFYKTMYWVEISDEDALDLLGNSYPPYGREA